MIEPSWVRKNDWKRAGSARIRIEDTRRGSPPITPPFRQLVSAALLGAPVGAPVGAPLLGSRLATVYGRAHDADETNNLYGTRLLAIGVHG